MPTGLGLDCNSKMIAAYLGLGAFTLLVCVFATPVGGWLRVVDLPDGQRKTHDRPTPLVGGLAIMVSVCAMAAIQAATTEFGPFYVTMLVALAAYLVLGFVDDRKHIRPVWRLAASFILGLVVILSVPAFEISFLKFSFLPRALFLDGWVGPIFTLLCLVGLQNAVNMADGKNGLVLGLSLVWTVLLFAYAPAHLYPLLAVLAITLAIGFVFNLTGRLFLGDSGTYSLSIAVGLLAIYCYQTNFATLPADIVALWFLVPVMDCLRLMATRVLRGRSPFTSDRNHLHHILERLMPWRRALPVYLAMVALPNLMALAWPQQTLLWALLTLSYYAVVVGASHRIFAQQTRTIA